MPDGSYLYMTANSSHLGSHIYVDGQAPVTGGATSVTDYAASWNDATGTTAVVDGTQGDLLYLHQNEERHEGPLSYSTISRTLALPPFTLSEDPAAPTTLSGEMQPVPRRSARLEWWRSQSEAWRVTVHPLATPGFSSLSLYPLPWGEDAWYGYMGELAYVAPFTHGQDLSLNFEYGNPYLSWGTAVNTLHAVRMPLRLPGTTSGTMTSVMSDTRVLKGDMEPLKLRISPPLAMKVNGQDAQVDQTLPSFTPTISWTAPRVGTPSAYRVTLRRLYTLSTSPTVTRYTNVATFHTGGTSLTVPPGVLQASQHYVISLTAFATPGVDFARAPYVMEVLADAASANSLSSILTAPASLDGTEERELAPEGSAEVEAEDPEALDASGRLRLNPKVLGMR